MKSKTVSSKLKLLGFLAALALLASSRPATADSAPRIRRFAFLAGVNDGGAGRVRLRYATSDAQAVSKVLTELGGVNPGDLVFAADTDRNQFLGALEKLRQNVAGSRRGDQRIELIFYYSGHSDEEGLLLRGEKLTYSELRARIEGIPADVRVAVLDSCASGAMTRGKGGVFRAPFMTDDSVKVKGHAFLTSSSADEVAQESDRIAASFFTHYLVSGLRGAADANRDRRVTFFEAYQFAAQETLDRTERTRGGAQHAAYDIQLNGSGDLVMTDVRATSAGLVLGADVHGAVAVRDPSAQLVAELRKVAGHPVELGLEPGHYLVSMTAGDARFEAEVTLAAGQRTEVDRLQFHLAKPLELARARGDGGEDTEGSEPTPRAATVEAPGPVTTAVAVAPGPVYRRVPFSLGLFPMPGSDSPNERLIKVFALSLVADRAARVEGMQLSLAANLVDETLSGTQVAVGVNMAGGDARGAQLAVGGNLVGGDDHGMQAAVGANLVRGTLHGAQMASGVNVVGGELHGVQMAAGGNLARGQLHGGQLAAGGNVALGGGRGLQAAAGFNWNGGDLHGAQLAAGFNGTAGAVSGAQLGGVNYASELRGLQLGLVNTTGVNHGLQLGLINVSDEDDGTMIGLISFARKNGQLRLAVYGNETTGANIGVKVGGRRIYSLLAIGLRPDGMYGASATPSTDSKGTLYSPMLALGLHTPFESPLGGFLSYLDFDVGTTSPTHDFSDNKGTLTVSTARLIGGWQVARHFSVIAGPTLNVLVRDADKDANIAPTSLEKVLDAGHTRVSMYPGFVLGVEI